MKLLEVGKPAGLSFLLAALIGGSGFAMEPADEGKARVITAPFHAGCQTRSIACGQTMAGTLNSSDCTFGDGSYVEFWEFSGQNGQVVTIDQESSTVDPYLLLYTPSDTQPSVRQDDDSGPGLDARIVHTLTQTGTWIIGANTAFAADSGTYNLSLACSTVSACSPSPTALCLNGNRFRVQATFAAPTGQSGPAQVIELTDQTGYLWFFNANNVEAVVKVINGCGTNNRYWVFAGGLTNVNTIITVTDTQTGSVKTYINPQVTPFQPIQDTSAFATCP